MLETAAEDYEPLFYVKDTADPRAGLTTAQIVDLLAEPGLDRERLTAQVRGFVMRKLIFPHAVLTSDGRRPYLFSAEQVFIAAVLRRLIPHSGGAALGTVSLVLNAWNLADIANGTPRLLSDPNTPASSPARFLIEQALGGRDGWCVEFASFRDPSHDLETVRARIRFGLKKPPTGGWVGTDWHVGPSYGSPLALTIIDLAPIVEHLFGSARAPQTAH